MVFPSSRPLKKGRSGLGTFPRPVEGQPRLEQVGGGLHPLPVDPEPEGIRLRAGAEAQSRRSHAPHPPGRGTRRTAGGTALALGPDGLGRAVRPDEGGAPAMPGGSGSRRSRRPASVRRGAANWDRRSGLGPRMSRQIMTSTCVTAPNSPDSIASQDLWGASLNT